MEQYEIWNLEFTYQQTQHFVLKPCFWVSLNLSHFMERSSLQPFCSSVLIHKLNYFTLESYGKQRWQKIVDFGFMSLLMFFFIVQGKLCVTGCTVGNLHRYSFHCDHTYLWKFLCVTTVSVPNQMVPTFLLPNFNGASSHFINVK